MKKLFVTVFLLSASSAVSAADLVDTLSALGQFTKFLDAIKAAGLEKTLRNPGPYTLLAPTDAAFEALPPDKIAELMRPENKQQLAKLLSHHLIAGRLLMRDVQGETGVVKSVLGLPIIIRSDKGHVAVNDARAAQVDIASDNGVIHAVERILLPPIQLVPRT